MDYEGENSLEDNYDDVLSDVPDDCDLEETSDSDTESVDSDISTGVRKRRRVMPLPSYSEESYEEMHSDWTEFDKTINNNEAFRGTPGPTVFPIDTSMVDEFADMFIGNDLFEFIATETNRYHAQNCGKHKQQKNSAKWFDVTVAELKKWFALTIIMGLVKKPRMEDHWSTNPLIETPIFSKTMSRNRFRQILTYIHFANNANMPPDGNRLFKVQYLIDYFSKKFEENFNLSQNICIDEGMIPCRGRLMFKTYNLSKITKYGILIGMLCDSASGYISSFTLYCGVGQSLNTTIMELLRRSFGKWHHLYMDNLYNSVALAKELLLKQIRVCGTIRLDRGLPDSLKNTKLKRSESLFKRQGEILLQFWQILKNRVVRMISTIHNAEFVDTGKICRKTDRPIQKPRCIIDYNQHMKGVDRADQYLSYYPIFKKTLKWSKKVALYLFNCSLFNAFTVHRHMNVSCGKTLAFRDFLLHIARYWIQDTDTEGNFENPTTSTHHHDPLHRLSGNLKYHQLIPIFPTNKRKRRRCHVCYLHRTRKTTRLMCKTCKVALYLGNCFATYHQKKKY
ncbi:PREDICTED: piggyBac transposable element-derived protein 4-like [Dufourea novaeangliae]|uniref:piggyBac transposable element-derived protein 4-like n=1 Tax=Dufourea novaeangliae TaxID=178035 RepID=UPI000767DD46|nr:PREDICTED: piggyBac transposable element-derived protein 4-like [Dufourea novaeangliae]